MKYDKDYFYNKFNAIPEDQWCLSTSAYRNPDPSKDWVLGFCTEEERYFIPLVFNVTMDHLNDGHRSIIYEGYAYAIVDYGTIGNTPKQRILNFLNGSRPEIICTINM